MSTLRVSNIEAKADASSPTIDEKVKVTSSQGRVLVQIDGKTAGITSIGINTTSTSFTIDGNQNIQFVGVITAANVNTTGVSTFTRVNIGTGTSISSPSSNTLTLGTNNTEAIRISGIGSVGIGTINPQYKLHLGGSSPHAFIQGNYSSTAPADHSRIYFNDYNFGIGCGNFGSVTDDDLYLWAYNGTGRDIKFCSTTDGSSAVNSASWTTNMIIKNDGKIGIGITNPAVTLSVAGTVNYTGTLQQNGSNVIQWVELTPGVTEWSWSSSVVSQAVTLNPSTIPSTARYVLADVFVTANSSDHQNIVLGRDVLTNQKNWVDTRGQQPSGQFGTLTRQAVTLTYNGESDGYTPNYGVWYSSQHVPCSGRTIYFNNYGQSGSSGWVYVLVKAYSL